MPYIKRDPLGEVESMHRYDPGDAELLGDDDPEVLAFVGADEFQQLDAGFVRVLEDLIDTLIMKNVINITDLPEQAQAKLFERKSFRARSSKESLQLFSPPTDFGDVI